MKKFLPLVALLTAVAFSVPALAADTKTAPTNTKEVHKVGKTAAHHGKKGAHKGKKHCDKKMDEMHRNTGAMIQSSAMHPRPMAPAKVYMPSMRKGFQK